MKLCDRTFGSECLQWEVFLEAMLEAFSLANFELCFPSKENSPILFVGFLAAMLEVFSLITG